MFLNEIKILKKSLSIEIGLGTFFFQEGDAMGVSAISAGWLAVGGWVTPSKKQFLGFYLGTQASKSRLYFSEADAVAISERRKNSEWVGG